MNFVTLQNKLITSTAARFNENQRADIKDWLNDRYVEMWNTDDWVFKDASASVTVSGSPPKLVLPADYDMSYAVYRTSDGLRLRYLPPTDFFDATQGTTYTGTPSVYSVVGTDVLVDCADTQAYTLYYVRSAFVSGNTTAPLVHDTDVPAIPVELHQALVHGAMASGSVMMNDFTYQFSEQKWQNSLDGMRNRYLRDVVDEPKLWGAPALWPSPQWSY